VVIRGRRSSMISRIRIVSHLSVCVRGALSG
jgi:hypothetical protein